MEISTNETFTGQASKAHIRTADSQQTSDLSKLAKAKAEEVAHSGQTLAADQLEHLAQGVRRSVDNFDEEQVWIKQGLSSAAQGIERWSSTLRNHDLSEIVYEAEDTARRHPVAFATACALAGFVLVRFLKSSRRDDDARGGDARIRAHQPDDYSSRAANRAPITQPIAHDQ